MSVNSVLSEILLQAEDDCSLERSITIITDINYRLQFLGPTASFQPLRLRSDIVMFIYWQRFARTFSNNRYDDQKPIKNYDIQT